MTTRVLLFDADGEDTELSPSGPLSRPGDRQLLWVDLEGRGELAPAELLSGLGLLPATLEALQGQGQGRPGLVHHGKYVVLNLNVAAGAAPFGRLRRARRGAATDLAPDAPDEAQAFSSLLVVAGENFVVTAHPSVVEPLSQFMAQMQGDTQLGKLDSAGFLVVLLSRVLESYFTATSRLEEATDELDEELLQHRRIPAQEPLDRLVELRHQAGVLRRELSAHRPIFMHLASPDFVVYAGDEREGEFVTLLNQFDHAVESVLQSRELVLGSFDLYMTGLGQRTNDIMRVLTVFTIALGILAAVAGLMGMNFEADVFKTGNRGFFDVLVGSALLIVVVLVVGRWRRWL